MARENAERVLTRAGVAPLFARAMAWPQEDMAPLVAAVAVARADATLSWGTQPAGAALLRALRAGGWAGRFLSNTMDDIFLGIAGDAAEGAAGFDCFAYSDPDPRIQAFCRIFRARWGKEPDAHATSNYDALMLLRDAVATAGLDREAVRPHLCGRASYGGVAHTYHFDPHGELHGWATVYEIRNGEALFLAKLDDTVEV